MTDNNDLKMAAILCGAFLALMFGAFASCNADTINSRESDIKAPIIETCIRHPSTRSVGVK